MKEKNEIEKILEMIFTREDRRKVSTRFRAHGYADGVQDALEWVLSEELEEEGLEHCNDLEEIIKEGLKFEV